MEETDLFEVEGGRGAAVVVVAVDVEHLEAIDGEQAGDDALLEARAEHNGVILLVHGGGGGRGALGRAEMRRSRRQSTGWGRGAPAWA